MFAQWVFCFKLGHWGWLTMWCSPRGCSTLAWGLGLTGNVMYAWWMLYFGGWDWLAMWCTPSGCSALDRGLGLTSNLVIVRSSLQPREHSFIDLPLQVVHHLVSILLHLAHTCTTISIRHTEQVSISHMTDNTWLGLHLEDAFINIIKTDSYLAVVVFLSPPSSPWTYSTDRMNPVVGLASHYRQTGEPFSGMWLTWPANRVWQKVEPGSLSMTPGLHDK